MEKFNRTTGLTPQQEKSAILLASGKTITETAKEVRIERSTLYQWAEKANFRAYFNSLAKQIMEAHKNSLFGLIDEAYKALGESLKSKNESLKLKAALSIIDRVKDIEIGETNPVKMIEKQCTKYNKFEFLVDTTFDQKRFQQLIKENNLTNYS